MTSTWVALNQRMSSIQQFLPTIVFEEKPNRLSRQTCRCLAETNLCGLTTIYTIYFFTLPSSHKLYMWLRMSVCEWSWKLIPCRLLFTSKFFSKWFIWLRCVTLNIRLSHFKPGRVWLITKHLFSHALSCKDYSLILSRCSQMPTLELIIHWKNSRISKKTYVHVRKYVSCLRGSNFIPHLDNFLKLKLKIFFKYVFLDKRTEG